MRPHISGKVTSKQAGRNFYHDQHSARKLSQRVMFKKICVETNGYLELSRRELVLYHIGESYILEDKCGKVILIN